jgi:hypothetical protein
VSNDGLIAGLQVVVNGGAEFVLWRSFITTHETGNGLPFTVRSFGKSVYVKCREFVNVRDEFANAAHCL